MEPTKKHHLVKPQPSYPSHFQTTEVEEQLSEAIPAIGNETIADHEAKYQTKQCPVFIKKTYKMIDTCDSNIATWSNNGQSFIIKDPDCFATNIIPQFFKSNNLNSFIRQLNLHGFRKIKTDRSTSSSKQKISNYMCFRHDSFVRDRPELLCNIPKPLSQQSPNRKELDSLVTEINDLKSTVAVVVGNFTQLKSIAISMISSLDNSNKRGGMELSKRSKIRKIGVDEDIATHRLSLVSSPDLNLNTHSLTSSIISKSQARTDISSNPDDSMYDNNNQINELDPNLHEISNSLPNTLVSNKNECKDGMKIINTKSIELTDEGREFFPLNTVPKNHPNEDLENDKFLDIFDEVMDDIPLDPNTITPSSIDDKIKIIGPEYALKLNTALSMLPDDMKHEFSKEHILSGTCSPEVLKAQVDDFYDVVVDIKGNEP